MEKIAFVACSNAGLSNFTNENIPTYYSKVNMDGKEFIDGVDMTTDEFYSKLRADRSLVPRTSMASTGEIVELFEKLASEGYTDIITIPISSKMSGTYQNTILAGSMVEDKIRVHSIDSKTTTYMQGYMSFRAIEMIKAGKSVSEIVQEVKRLREHCYAYFAVDTLQYLVKNGRISGASGFIGGLLKIKPLVSIDREGQIYSMEKIKTTSKVHARALEVFLEQASKFEKSSVKPFILHSDNIEYANFMKSELEKHGYTPECVVLLPPVIGCHVGPDCVTLGLIID